MNVSLKKLPCEIVNLYLTHGFLAKARIKLRNQTESEITEGSKRLLHVIHILKATLHTPFEVPGNHCLPAKIKKIITQQWYNTILKES